MPFLESCKAVSDDQLVADVLIIDGCALLHILHPTFSKTFQEYGDNVFGTYILDQLRKHRLVDVVWDVYIVNSLKAATRERGSKGCRRRVTPSTAVPANWEEFLACSDNKT